jgi:thiamine biosynthesis lipoprotein
MPGLLGLVLAALLITGCRPADDPLVTHRLFVMATWVDIRLPQSATDDDTTLMGVIESELRQFENDYYAWGTGELSELNRSLTDSQQFDASEPMAQLLATAREFAVATDGAFDPGVGALVELWGFHAAEPDKLPPEETEISERLAATGSILDLEIGGRRVGISTTAAGPEDPEFTLDLGGIAKGAAVDLIVARLDAFGIVPALVNAGGDLRVVGAPPDRDWRIGIAAPRDSGILGTVRLLDHEAAFTSGDYERFFEHEGDRFHHILDPRTGMPVSHTQAVTVIADNGTIADAAATALFVAGPEAWRSMAAELGIAAALRVDASGRIEMTPAMRERLQPSPEVSSDIIIAAD